MINENRQIFFGMQILSEKKWLTDHAVIVENNLIKAVIHQDMIKHHLPATKQEFPRNFYLIPGLIDLHVHGADNCDVMDGTDASLFKISFALAREGVTGFLATTMTAEVERIETVLQCIAKTAPVVAGAAILGVHLEGPFISAEKAGAQAKIHVQAPSKDKIGHWQKLAEDTIRLVTLAPELPGAMELISALHKMDIIASIGHTNATYDETRAAIKAGCTQATHLFNAMSGIQQREPGAVTALLLARDLNAELIVDGFHLHPAIVELAYRLKGRDHLLLVSDAMRAKCMGDGCYELGGQDVHVNQGKATLADGTLAGSTLHLPQAIKNMAAFSGCSLIDAIQMATFNPAHVLGLSRQKGVIEVGKDADLVVLNADFDVQLTVRAGRAIFAAD